MTAPTRARPALRYHGGKWKLAPWILSFFPAHRIYVEPFGGAGSVLLRKTRSYGEVYNDLDGEVVNLFRVLRDPVDAQLLETALRLTPFAREEFVQSYLPGAGSVEQARRTVVRSYMGFGSASASGHVTGFRSNSNRSGTTPAHDWVNYPSHIATYTERLRGVVIENRDAARVIAQHDQANALHYVDPPYPKSARSDTGDDYRHEMTDDDHLALAAVFRSVKGMVVLSGYGCALYEDAYHDWERHERAALGDGAKQRIEVVWLNPACVAAREAERNQHPLFARPVA